MSDESELVSPEPSTELVRVQNSPPAVLGFAGLDLQSLFDKAVTASDSVQVLERLMVIRREMNAETAKRQYDAAMKAFQAECPAVEKGRPVKDRDGSILYHYAPMEDIVEAVKPYLEKYGFSYTFDTDTKSEPGWCIAICRVKHEGGHTESPSVKLPLGAGTRAMSTTQIFSAALTFANRRAFVNAFGITLKGEDKDGADPTKREKLDPPGMADKKDAVDAALKRELTDLTRHIHGVASGYNLDAGAKQHLRQWLTDENVIRPEETVTGLTGGRLAEVVAKAKKKLGK